MKDERYPIYFMNGTCAVCGAENAVYPIDKFGRKAKKTDIFPIYRMECFHCKREFFIRWEEINDEDHSAVAVPVSKNIIDKFIETARKEQQKESGKNSQIPLLYDRYEVTDFGTF